MEYILFTLTSNKDSAMETLLDDNVLKEIPFGSKFKTPRLSYNNILVEKKSVDPADTDYTEMYDTLSACITQFTGSIVDEDTKYTLYSILKPVLPKLNNRINMSIDVLGTINDSEIDILYTDGSFSKSSDEASYACCKLLNEDNVNGTQDLFTQKKWAYQPFSGKIDNGTNNIGELTAIKVASENLSDKKYQIIISDSIYGLKSYREYIYVWKNNGYRTYSNKEIKNKDLIMDTFATLTEAGKTRIILYKWTKGHNNDNFNEICDELAKKELNI